MILSLVLFTGLMAGSAIGGLIGGLGCKKEIAVDYMTQCKEEPNMAVAFKEMYVLKINKTEYAFNGKIEFLEAVGEPWKLHFQLSKCTSKDSTKTCDDKFFVFDIDKICEKLPEKNQVWSGFVEEMKLDTKCPLQPKLYNIDNILIDADAMKYFPIGNAFYKLKITGFTTKKILCVDIAFTISCKK